MSTLNKAEKFTWCQLFMYFTGGGKGGGKKKKGGGKKKKGEQLQ